MTNLLLLPLDFQPDEKHVLCGRGKRYQKHAGNINYLNLVRAKVQRYQDAPKRFDKTMVVANLVEELYDSGFRFLQRDPLTDHWCVMDDANDVHKKVSYSIRDVVKSDKKKGNNPNTTAGISTMKSTAAIKEKQQQQATTVCSSSSSSICFEPLCHINTRPIKRFSIKSSAILASILNDDIEEEEEEEEKENSFAPLSPPPTLPTPHYVPSLPTPHYVPEEASFIDEPMPISGDVEDILMSATRILTSDDTFDDDSYHRVSVCSMDEGNMLDFQF